MINAAGTEGLAPLKQSRGHLRQDRWVPIALAIIGLLLYLTFRSSSLDDFDSYSFALALETFDVTLQQPQPPGFPIYIGLARFLMLLQADPVFALTTLSALSGAMSMLLIYLLAREGVPYAPQVAVLGALLFGLAPVTWLTSGKALSDMPGMMWTLLALWLWQRWAENPAEGTPSRPLPCAAALVTGLSLGVRPQNTLPLMLFIGWLFTEDLVNHRSLQLWLGVLALGTVATLIWLVPTAIATGGFQAYFATIRHHAAHVGRADSLLGVAAPLSDAFRIRLIALADTLLISLIGTGVYAPLSSSATWRLLALAAMTVPSLIGLDGRSRWTRLLMGWLFLVTAQTLLLETLDRPRLLLPLLPPLTLLVATGWAKRRYSHYIVGAVAALGALVMLIQTAPWAAQLSQALAPPTQATTYILNRYPAERTLVAAAGSFRAAQVELPNYTLAYLYRFDAAVVDHALKTGTEFIAILDRDQFTPEAINVLSQGSTWVTLEDQTFTRDRRVHSQHDQVRLQILVPSATLPPEALALPSDGCLYVGGADNGRHLGEGWFRPEEIAGVPGRWAGQTLTTTLRLMLEPTTDYALRLHALAYPAGQRITLRINGQTISTLTLPQAWSYIEARLPESEIPRAAPLTLELVHARAESPFQVSRGTSSDTRLLTAAYESLCLTPLEETSD